jgi:peptide/nickel transport system permease protein
MPMKRIYAKFFLFGTFLRRLTHSRSALWGVMILGFWIAVTILTLFWTPHSITQFHLNQRLQSPSSDFLFGTDKFGRDVFSRVLAGSKEVIVIALSGTLLGLLVGTVIGLTAGYFGGLYDEIAMRLMDIFMSFPSLLLALLVLGMLGPGLINVIIVIGIVFSPRVARVARSAVLDIKFKEFVEAAKARGEKSSYLIVVEILPNALGPLGVEFAVRFAYAIFLSASLGFLGLGVQPPAPDWGLMVSEGRDFMEVAPWVVLFPALAIASLVVGVNLLSDGVRQLAAGEI